MLPVRTRNQDLVPCAESTPCHSLSVPAFGKEQCQLKVRPFARQTIVSLCRQSAAQSAGAYIDDASRQSPIDLMSSMWFSSPMHTPVLIQRGF